MTWEGGQQYVIDRKWDNTIDLSKIHYISNGIMLDTFDNNLDMYSYEDPDLVNEKR